MLVTFKAEGAADVLMFGEVAQVLMKVMGKEVGTRGVVTVEQLPQALARLKAAITSDHAAPQPLEPTVSGRDQAQPEAGRFVSLSQRALPLVALLEQALADEVPVVWGL